MKPFNLARKLVLEQASRVPDGSGGHVVSWVALGTLWADVQAGTGGERYAEFVTLSNVAYRIIVRGAPQGAPSSMQTSRPRATPRRLPTRVCGASAAFSVGGNARTVGASTLEEAF